MTHDDILALSLRELDALVAEKIEGLPVVWAPDPYRIPDRRLTGRHPWHKRQVNGENKWIPVKRHVTDWGLMRQAIETMKERGWWCQLQSPFSPDNLRPGGHLYYATFIPHNVTDASALFHGRMPGEDAPQAVARAAIWALEDSAR